LFGINGLFRNSIDGYKYHYGLLNDGQKAVYKKMLSGFETFSQEIALPIMPVNETAKIFNHILLDNPLLFYVSSFSQSNDLYKKRCSVMPEYKYMQKFVRESNNIIMEFLGIFDTLRTKSDVDKEINLHDYCLNTLRYNFSFNDYSNSILGVVLNKSAVCEGISKFVKLAFDYLGIKSLVVNGKAKNPLQDSSMEPHAWNIVEIAGNTYHLDVTYDMTMKGKTNRYDYFNLSDEDIKKDHVIISDAPLCTTIGNDYFSTHSLVMRNPAELENYIRNNLKKGKKDITVKVLNVRDSENISDRILDIAKKQFTKIFNSGTIIEISSNISQMVFEISFK